MTVDHRAAIQILRTFQDEQTRRTADCTIENIKKRIATPGAVPARRSDSIIYYGALERIWRGFIMHEVCTRKDGMRIEDAVIGGAELLHVSIETTKSWALKLTSICGQFYMTEDSKLHLKAEKHLKWLEGVGRCSPGDARPPAPANRDLESKPCHRPPLRSISPTALEAWK